MKKYILSFLYLIAFLLAILILSLVLDYNPLNIELENKASLLSALGIIISAFIASLSVMVSIENTNSIEEKRKVEDLYKRLETSFYMLEKNKENIRCLECYPKVNNPLFHKKSILDILNISLKNLAKLETCETISPVTISRLESYIFAMKFIVDKLPEERGIDLTEEFNEYLKNFKDVTVNTIENLTTAYSGKKFDKLNRM